MKLRNLVKESWYDKSKQLTKEQKADFLKKVGGYNGLGKAVYSEHNLVEIAKQLQEICQMAETIALNETGEDFDKITVQRNMKELKGLSGNFAKVATEAQDLRNRLSGLYEDMGHILNRYYNIEEMREEVQDELEKDMNVSEPKTFAESNQQKSVSVKTPSVVRM